MLEPPSSPHPAAWQLAVLSDLVHERSPLRSQSTVCRRGHSSSTYSKLLLSQQQLFPFTVSVFHLVLRARHAQTPERIRAEPISI
jgi:hypothetical protein